MKWRPLLNSIKVVDEANSELRILNRRHVMMDAAALCRHLETLTGAQVAEVIIGNHASQLGKEDAEEIRKQRPQATIQDLLAILAESSSLSGFGVTRARLLENPSAGVYLEISNPAVKSTTGAGKALVFSYWCGALGYFAEKEFEATDVTYDEQEDISKCQIVPKGVR
jgi:hypothetical protein